MNKVKSRHIWILFLLSTVLFDGGYAKGNNREEGDRGTGTCHETVGSK